MAPPAAVCSAMVQKESQESKAAVAGKKRMALDSWVSQPTTQEAMRASSSSSKSESSCTTQKGVSLEKARALDEALAGEGEEACLQMSAFVTPKSRKHRVPVVDIDHCPPAPKKPRAVSRMQVVCALKFESTNFFQKLNASPNYLS
ncbi:uncharacterized protein [Physcomitrium patens]|uniref:Uncharacterized protein n=1 Tax=Physcomitrium patens TaxID=3218 RepID=A9TVG8_PHYPA|nr:uncharacterized protein LOC112276122 [Physcomitrium patens]PNR29710.1 hypothetical protein PHYPA_028404 [Physcomitrium patens]|eukprot:XP_024362929.1 uncharacterized protein LOC112276122 [Physcomitrella patens]